MAKAKRTRAAGKNGGRVAAKKKATAKKAAARRRAGAEFVRVPVHTVVKFVRMLHDEKYGDHFLVAAEKSKAWVELHPSAVRLVRKYVADKNLHETMDASVIDPAPGGYECPCVRR